MSQINPPVEKVLDPLGSPAAPSERTLEVVALYNQSPQRVLHLAAPASGRPRAASVVMLALGFTLLLGGAWSFVHQLLRVHRETLHRATVVEFIRERGLSEKLAPKVTARPGIEIASVAASASGLFLFLFGGLRLREERRRPSFRIGEDPRADYPLPSAALPSTCFELISADAEGYRVHLTDSMDGEASLPDGARLALADLAQRGLAPLDPLTNARSWLIPEGGRCRVELGTSAFLLHATRSSPDLVPEALPARALGALRSPLAVSTLGSAVVLVAFLALLQWRPRDSDNLEVDSLSDARQRFVRELQASAQKDRTPPPRPEERRRPVTPPPLASRVKATKVLNQPSRPIDERIVSASPGAGIGATPGRSASQALGQNAGMVSVLRAASPRLASMFSRQAAMSQEAEDSLAAITGYTYGGGDPLAGIGDGGRGGGSPGAGGVSPCGAFCSYGKEPFGGFPSGGIPGGVPLGPGVPQHQVKDPQVFHRGKADVLEGIDGDTIQRIIRRHLSQIRYCYQAVGLPTSPRLEGELRVAFLISPAGRVLRAEIASSSLRNPATEQCVLSQIRTWRFPKTGGRTAYVVYPFRFRPSGTR